VISRVSNTHEGVNHLNLYRLPWNLADNGISWLEPTTKCNLRCEGCYRDLENPVHKSLEQVRNELETFKRLRKSDCMSIAGGDPLLYPQIVKLVRMIKKMGWKPIINTNGIALDEALLADLKKAGVFGFTFHIDTSQNRPKAKRKSETELNEVRQYYAEMLAASGGLCCSFNATINEMTMDELPNLVRWAERNANIVQAMVFILFRSPEIDGNTEYYANNQKVNLYDAYKDTQWGGSKSIFADDVVNMIREADPGYLPSAYLNGTAGPESLKWLIANRLVLDGHSVGYVSPKLMEITQNVSHLVSGTYLAYPSRPSTARGKLAAFCGSLFDASMRRAFLKMLRRTIARPGNLLRRAYVQTITIVQPVNFGVGGTNDMCDGCPDMTVHNGRLEWSCRLEELNKFGAFADAAPRERAPAARKLHQLARKTG